MSLIGVPVAPPTITVWIDLTSDPPRATCRDHSVACPRFDPEDARGLEMSLREVLASFPPERPALGPWYRICFTGCDHFRSRFGPLSVDLLRDAARAAGATYAEESPTPPGELATRTMAAVAIAAGIALALGAVWWVLRLAAA